MPITYPIQETDRFTVWNTDANAPLKDGKGRNMNNQKWGSEDASQMIDGLADNIKWLLETREDQPAYDSATQRLEKNDVADVADESFTFGWTIVALTQDEIDAKTPDHYETTGGIKMAVDVQSQAAFSNMMTLLNEAGMADTDPVAIKDCFGASHGMSVAEFRAIAVAYGLHCYTIFHS